MAEPLEVRFFSAERKWKKGLTWYEELFADSGAAAAVGEKSVDYTRYPYFRDVPARLARVLPDARLIYLVRNPIERSISQYRNFIFSRNERRAPEEALLEDAIYIDPSRYAFQLEQYTKHYPAEQILVVRSEELRDEREQVVNRIAYFLGVEPHWRWDDLAIEENVTATKQLPNAPVRALTHLPGWTRFDDALPKSVKTSLRRVTHRPRPMAEVPHQIREELARRFRDDVAALRERWLGAEFEGWGLLAESDGILQARSGSEALARRGIDYHEAGRDQPRSRSRSS